MPLQRRLPKVGFRSRMAKYSAELRLHELELPTADVIDMDVLKTANLVPAFATKVKVIKSGEIKKAVKLKGLAVTKGARAADRESWRHQSRNRTMAKKPQQNPAELAKQASKLAN